MKIGLYINGKKNSVNSRSNVLGEELLGETLCKALLKIKEVESAVLYASNYLPSNSQLDFMIYLNDTEPNTTWAKKHILYMQNAYPEGSEVALKKFQNIIPRNTEYMLYTYLVKPGSQICTDR